MAIRFHCRHHCLNNDVTAGFKLGYEQKSMLSIQTKVEFANTQLLYILHMYIRVCQIDNSGKQPEFCRFDVLAKARLQKEGIFFLIHLFARDILLMKKLEIEETKTTQFSTFETDMIKVCLVFFNFQFFHKEKFPGK